MDNFINVSLFINVTTATNHSTQWLTTVPPPPPMGNYDSPYNFMSQETKRFLRTFSTPLYFFTALFGSVTNMISMIIFYRQGLRTDSCTPSLWALALTDFCTNTNIVVTMCIIFRNNVGILTFQNNKYLYSHLSAVAWLLGQPVRSFLEMSSWTMVYLSVDRMVSVAFPFKVKEIFTPKRTYIIIGCIWLWGFLIYLPAFIMNKWVYRSYENGTVTIIRVTSTGFITTDEAEMINIVKDGPIRFLRISLVTICNSIIIYKVRQSKKFKEAKSGITQASNQIKTEDKKVNSSSNTNKESSNPNSSNKQQSQEQKETKLIRLILVLSFIYVGCYFPVFMREILYYIDTYVVEFGYWFDPYWLVDWITDYFEFINTSVNFLVYIPMSTRYREELNKLFACRR